MPIPKHLILLLCLLLIVFSPVLGQKKAKKTSATEKDLEQATAYFNQGAYDISLEYTEKLLRTYPNNHVLLSLKGRTLFNLGQEQEGISTISRAITIVPKNDAYYGYRGIMYKLTGDCTKAIRDMNMALISDPDNIIYLTARADCYQQTGDTDKALLEYKEVLNRNPEEYTLLVANGAINRKAGNYTIALDYLNHAIKLKPGNAIAYEERAQLYITQQQYEQAIKDFDKTLELTPDTEEDKQLKAFAYNNRGFARFRAGQTEEAIEDINHSLQLFPGNSYAYKNRALVYLSLNRKSPACSDLAKAQELGYKETYGQEVEELLKQNCQ